MHKASRIFVALLLVLCIQAQSKPEPLLKGSRAPFEKILRGTSNDICSDTFHWDNVRYFSDIAPGRCNTPQREMRVIAMLALLMEAYVFYNIIEYSHN